MDTLKVLVTNLELTARSGTELYARDLALELLRRGHRPVVYAPIVGGTTVDELRRATFPVVDRLESIGFTPDVIHGHHAHQTMAALLHFETTPALFVCHDYTAWHDDPPRFPRNVDLRAANLRMQQELEQLCAASSARSSTGYRPLIPSVVRRLRRRFRPGQD
jgi:hypothetical protein